MNDLNLLPQSDFVKRVWDDLSSVDLEGYTKKLAHVGNATYLSWSNAWTLLMQRYPWSTDEYTVVYLDNKSVEVRCKVTISDGAESFTREMHLPVMDQKNQAIFDPSTRAISDTKARCLVKCLSKFGLGLYLYNGDEFARLEKPENIPHGNITDDQSSEIHNLLDETESDSAKFYKFFGVENLADLPAARFKEAKALLEAKAKRAGDAK